MVKGMQEHQQDHLTTKRLNLEEIKTRETCSIMKKTQVFLFNNNTLKLKACKGCLFIGNQIKLEIQIKVGNMRKLTSSKIKPYISSKISPKKYII